MYATFGPKGSYKTGSTFANLCARRDEIDIEDAMTCSVLRPEVERALRAQFPGREIKRPDRG